MMVHAAEPNNREEDARHFHISISLHCVRPMTRRFATFIADDRNDFFPMDVRRHARAQREESVFDYVAVEH